MLRKVERAAVIVREIVPDAEAALRKAGMPLPEG